MKRITLVALILILQISSMSCAKRESSNSRDPIAWAFSSRNRDSIYMGICIIRTYSQRIKNHTLDYSATYDLQKHKIQAYFNLYQSMSDEQKQKMRNKFTSMSQKHSPIWSKEWE